MRLTQRGYVVVGSFFAFVMLAISVLIARHDAIIECATFQANNDYKSALAAGCSFDRLSNGEYPYTWKAN